MTQLLVHELQTSLESLITINSAKTIYAVRPHLHCHNSPAGTFTIGIYDISDNLIQAKTFTSADIVAAMATANLYIHGYFTVTFDNVVPIVIGDYKIKLTSSGYTFSESSYLGWVADHENLKIELDYTPTSDLENPLSFELWGFK